MIAVQVEDVVLPTSKLLRDLPNDLPEPIVHHLHLSEVQLAIELEIRSAGLDYYHSRLVGVSGHHAIAVLLVAESPKHYLISIPVWQAPSPRMVRQELQLVKSQTFRQILSVFILYLNYRYQFFNFLTEVLRWICLAQIVTLLFITRYQQDMSFLQLISRHANTKYQNPAFQQLEKCNLPTTWSSFKSEPREVNPTEMDEIDRPRRTYLKTRAASVNQGNLSRATQLKALKPSKSQFQSSKDKMQGQSPSRRVDTKPQKRQQQGRQVKYHHSFSNYLAKKHIGVRQGNLRSKFMYYDLNEIVHKISSPMKLEHKLQEDEQFQEQKEKKVMSLSHYQKFLREVNHQKNRYNQVSTSRELKHKGSVDQKKDGYLEMILESRELRPRPKTLWLRQIVQKQIKQDHGIVPWLQNQEQNSPIKTNNRYSALGVEKPSTDDFQALLA